QAVRRGVAAHDPAKRAVSRVRERDRYVSPHRGQSDALPAARRGDLDAGRLHGPTRAPAGAHQALRGRCRRGHRRANAIASRAGGRASFASPRAVGRASVPQSGGRHRSVRHLQAVPHLRAARCHSRRRRRADRAVERLGSQRRAARQNHAARAPGRNGDARCALRPAAAWLACPSARGRARSLSLRLGKPSSSFDESFDMIEHAAGIRRRGLTLGVALIACAFASGSLGTSRAAFAQAASEASPPARADSAATYPFGVGETLTYTVAVGGAKVGSGDMKIVGIDTVQGHPTFHSLFTVDGGFLMFKVHDVLESWFDTSTLSSRRFVQKIHEVNYVKERDYDIWPERSEMQQHGYPEMASVPNPLDDGSFLYFVRTVPLEVGKTYTFNRYFRPDRNPVIVKVLR